MWELNHAHAGEIILSNYPIVLDSLNSICNKRLSVVLDNGYKDFKKLVNIAGLLIKLLLEQSLGVVGISLLLAKAQIQVFGELLKWPILFLKLVF